MRVSNDKYRIAKDITVGDLVDLNFKFVIDGKFKGYRTAYAAITRIGKTSFWVVNPFTLKEEAQNINTFLKRRFFSKITQRWEILQKHYTVNMDYV